jgi:hypothetical protein
MATRANNNRTSEGQGGRQAAPASFFEVFFKIMQQVNLQA